MISFFPPLLKEVDLQVQTLLIAVIYCVGFCQDHFSSDAHRCMAILNDNGTLGQNLSFPTFLPPTGLHGQHFYLM